MRLQFMSRCHPFVQRLNGFVALGDDDLWCLDQLVEHDLRISKRTEMVHDGFQYAKLCVVETGFGSRYKVLPDGRCQIVNLILPGDVVGLQASFLEAASYSVAALSDMRVQSVNFADYVRACYVRPQLGLALCWLAVQESLICADHAVNAGRRTPLERLAHFIMELYGRLEFVGLASNSTFELPFSQEVMSDLLGLSVPHLNKTLARLCNDGVLRRKGRSIAIADERRLQRLGHFQARKVTRVPDRHVSVAVRSTAERHTTAES